MPGISYEFYRSRFGGSLPEADFSRFLSGAEAYVHALTLGRSNGIMTSGQPPGIAEKVRLAVCAVAEIDAQTEASGTLSAESTDGYSVTYATTAQAEKRRYSEALRYLAMTGLMYSGII